MDIKIGTYLIALCDVPYSRWNNRILRFTKGKIYKVYDTVDINQSSIEEVEFSVISNYGIEIWFILDNTTTATTFRVCSVAELRSKKIEEIFG